MVTDINPYSGFRPLPRCSFQSPSIVTSDLYVSGKAFLSVWVEFDELYFSYLLKMLDL